MGLVQLAGELGEQALGLQRRLGVVSLAHPPLGHLPQPVRQLVDHVSDLVQP